MVSKESALAGCTVHIEAGERRSKGRQGEEGGLSEGSGGGEAWRLKSGTQRIQIWLPGYYQEAYNHL